MKSSFLKKATAIVCGAATIATLSVAAITASADGTVMVADKTTLAAPTTDAVKYTVKLQGNPGVTNINFTLKYDSRLKPVTEIDEDENKEVLKFETGYAGMASAFVNENAEGLGAIIGCGIVGSSKMTGDNDVLTVWFKLPSDAKAGDKYAISFDDPATEFLNGSKAVEVSSEAGYIEIATPTTTEATTTTTEETTTTTEETTSATTTSSEVTTSATTASSSEAASGTTSTSASNNGTSASATTTTTKATTTKAGGNGGTTNSGKQDGPTAGDAGVALAIAGLLAAAGTAIVARKKD
ncbi:MAG: hypothetical protein IK130_08365 [Oscillospiraceae bacterium]|nr:hypothetical protein [Oscillospiraceae bacterium]